jgi:glutamate N-acetyltransferase / amino-acid N-acetyltransferase
MIPLPHQHTAQESRNATASGWEPVDGSLATPRGFRAASVASGIKRATGAPDLALIFSEVPQTTAAGVFTTNLAAAAPVFLSRRNLRESRGQARAVVVNSGNANACTGAGGIRVAEGTVAAAATLLGVPAEQILVASTGVIGVPLEPKLILSQLPTLKENLSVENAASVARAIMTTDTTPKSYVLRSRIDGETVHLAGVAKGSGMIYPRLATLLCFITTDALVGPRMLHYVLRAAVEVSFNRVSVDGDTSTNDSVIAMANGASGVAVRPGNQSRAWFLAGLTHLCQALARMIARDGEGAKKLVTIEVGGAKSDADAELVARAIANSPLVKTAVAGSDPNWGRIVCAAGYSGATFNPEKVDILVNDLFLCRKGVDAGFDEAAARRELDLKELTLRVDLHAGRGCSRIWTCDLTHDYITINASYRT